MASIYEFVSMYWWAQIFVSCAIGVTFATFGATISKVFGERCGCVTIVALLASFAGWRWSHTLGCTATFGERCDMLEYDEAKFWARVEASDDSLDSIRYNNWSWTEASLVVSYRNDTDFNRLAEAQLSAAIERTPDGPRGLASKISAPTLSVTGLTGELDNLNSKYSLQSSLHNGLPVWKSVSGFYIYWDSVKHMECKHHRRNSLSDREAEDKGLCTSDLWSDCSHELGITSMGPPDYCSCNWFSYESWVLDADIDSEQYLLFLKTTDTGSSRQADFLDAYRVIDSGEEYTEFGPSVGLLPPGLSHWTTASDYDVDFRYVDDTHRVPPGFLSCDEYWEETYDSYVSKGYETRIDPDVMEYRFHYAFMAVWTIICLCSQCQSDAPAPLVTFVCWGLVMLVLAVLSHYVFPLPDERRWLESPDIRFPPYKFESPGCETVRANAARHFSSEIKECQGYEHSRTCSSVPHDGCYIMDTEPTPLIIAHFFTDSQCAEIGLHLYTSINCVAADTWLDPLADIERATNCTYECSQVWQHAAVWCTDHQDALESRVHANFSESCKHVAESGMASAPPAWLSIMYAIGLLLLLGVVLMSYYYCSDRIQCKSCVECAKRYDHKQMKAIRDLERPDASETRSLCGLTPNASSAASSAGDDRRSPAAAPPHLPAGDEPEWNGAASRLGYRILSPAPADRLQQALADQDQPTGAPGTTIIVDDGHDDLLQDVNEASSATIQVERDMNSVARFTAMHQRNSQATAFSLPKQPPKQNEDEEPDGLKLERRSALPSDDACGRWCRESCASCNGTGSEWLHELLGLAEDLLSICLLDDAFPLLLLFLAFMIEPIVKAFIRALCKLTRGAWDDFAYELFSEIVQASLFMAFSGCFMSTGSGNSTAESVLPAMSDLSYNAQAAWVIFPVLGSLQILRAVGRFVARGCGSCCPGKGRQGLEAELKDYEDNSFSHAINRAFEDTTQVLGSSTVALALLLFDKKAPFRQLYFSVILTLFFFGQGLLMVKLIDRTTYNKCILVPFTCCVVALTVFYMPLAFSIDTGLFDSVFATFIVLVPCICCLVAAFMAFVHVDMWHPMISLSCCAVFGLDFIFAALYGVALLVSGGVDTEQVHRDLSLVSLAYGENTTSAHETVEIDEELWVDSLAGSDESVVAWWYTSWVIRLVCVGVPACCLLCNPACAEAVDHEHAGTPEYFRRKASRDHLASSSQKNCRIFIAPGVATALYVYLWMRSMD